MDAGMPAQSKPSNQPSIRELLDARPTKLLALGFVVIMLLMVALVVSTLSRIDAIGRYLDSIVAEHNSENALVYRMLDAARGRATALQGIALDEDPFVRDEEMMRFHALGTEMAEARRAFLAMELSPEEKAIMAAQTGYIAEVLRVQQKVIDLAQEGRLAEARTALFGEATPTQLKIYDSLGQMVRLQQEEVSEEAEKASALEKEVHLILLAGGAVAALLSALIALFSTQRIRVLMQGIRDGSEHLEAMVAERTAELREREEIMRRMTGAANDAVIMIDEHDAVTFWNQAAEKIFGYAEGEVMGRPLHDLIMPERFRGQQVPALAIFSESGEGQFIGQTREVVALRRDGSEFPAELSLSAVRVRGGWRAIGLARDITDRKRAEEVLKQLATTDPLTGVANRRKFDEVLDAEVKRSSRYDIALTLLLFDIDHFKAVNDKYGHLVGDQVLVEFTRLVSENVRANDHFARWGGEEFVLLSAHCDEECTERFAEKLRLLIAAHNFPEVGQLTCSFGLSGLRPGDSAAGMVARADEALYQAKSQGRNQVCRARVVDA